MTASPEQISCHESGPLRPRPLDGPVLFLATGLGLGLLPLAPGTWGSLLGLPLSWILAHLAPLTSALALSLAALMAIYICDRAQAVLDQTDSPRIVLDETVGMAVALAGIPFTAQSCLTAFVLFRVLDIWKPFPIRQMEKKLRGGFGVVADDVLAGVMANLAWRVGAYLVSHVR